MRHRNQEDGKRQDCRNPEFATKRLEFLSLQSRLLAFGDSQRFRPEISSIACAVTRIFDSFDQRVDIGCRWIVFDPGPVRCDIDFRFSHATRLGERGLDSVDATRAAHSRYCKLGFHRVFLYMRSINSSYISVASGSPARIADVAQCLRWLRMSSRPTARSASC